MGKRRTSIMILSFDGRGLCLFSKRLDRGGRPPEPARHRPGATGSAPRSAGRHGQNDRVVAVARKSWLFSAATTTPRPRPTSSRSWRAASSTVSTPKPTGPTSSA
ncbi:hypothetical protein [Sorangium sp. So ce406]|uniref:hypothetical protein n=1 Tax=Sorangium sp. So ce406 TaxID=3133311 RepID=UPI003F5BD51E